MKGLNGRTAIVSGGATLIGQAVAQTLTGYGVTVFIADINDADGTAAAERIGASFVHADITVDADIAALIEKVTSTTGRLDYLVNVACTYLDNGADTARADWLKALDVNIVGSVMLMQAARPYLKCTRARSSISARSPRASRRPGAGSIPSARRRSCN
jgi:NAD(P)-dependent dehydrogenase (short-subunit alcohol dehydrogenase family)